MPLMTEDKKIKLLSAIPIKRIYCENDIVYSSGNIVTYVVDTDLSYEEEVEEEETCLSPKTFTPTKSGWIFLGWREDDSANSDVLTNKDMGDDPVTLYAVFQKIVTVTYYNNSTTASTTSKYRYYNNENIVNPSFTLTQSSLSGWNARGWSTTNSGDASITYNDGAAFTRDSDITLYGLYQQTITLSYNGNGSTGGSTAAQTGTRYAAPGGLINPSFTLRSNGFSRTNYNFSKWASGSASGTQYSVGATVTLSANTTFYAIWTGIAFYVINNGSLVNGNYTSAVRNRYNSGFFGYDTDYGTYKHGGYADGAPNETDPLGPYITFNARGCSKIRIVVKNSLASINNCKLTATGSIGTKNVQYADGSATYGTYTGTIDPNTTNASVFFSQENKGFNGWLEATIKEIYLYN